MARDGPSWATQPGEWSSSPSPLSLSLEGQVGACHHGHLTPVSPLAFPVTCSFSDTHILLGSFSSRGLRSTGLCFRSNWSWVKLMQRWLM